MYKTKTLAKIDKNRKSCCSVFYFSQESCLKPISSDFKTILKGSSFLGLRSLVFVLYQPVINNDVNQPRQILLGNL